MRTKKRQGVCCLYASVHASELEDEVIARMGCPKFKYMRVSICIGDKVAQLVRCRTSNQRVAGSIPGFGLSLGKTVYSILLQSTQL